MKALRVRPAAKPAFITRIIFFVTSNLARGWIIRPRWCLKLPSIQLFKCQREVPPVRRVVAVPQHAVVIHHDDERPNIFPLDTQLLQPVSLQLQVVVWQLFNHEAGRPCKQHVYILLHPFCEVSQHPQCPLSEQRRCFVSGFEVSKWWWALGVSSQKTLYQRKVSLALLFVLLMFDATFNSVTLIQGSIAQLRRLFSHTTCDSHWLLQTIFHLWPTVIKHHRRW